jgi:hypothetical protein
MVCLETFESGEVHVVYCNFTTGSLVDFCWPNVAASTTPNTATSFAGFGSAGKIGSVVDDARRCIHVMGLSGNYAKISAAGGLISQQAVFAPVSGGDVPEYFSLSLDDAGSLYVAAACATSASPPEYDAVVAMMSPNPGDLSPAWYAGSWTLGAVLTLPTNPAPMVYLTLGEQARRNNNVLMSSTVSSGRMHALICETPGSSERPYVYDDFRDLTAEAISLDWNTPAALKSASSHRPMKGQTLFPKCAAGGICQRASGLYAVVHDRTNLLALVSNDNGKSWQDYAQTSLLPYLGTGTDVTTWWTPRDLGISRGDEHGTGIVGMLTIMQCSPSIWASAASGFNPPASTYSFSLPT